MKKAKGITLVALVITIVVLIILAGVSMTTIIGEEGIINKAKQAKENMGLAQIEEEDQLNILYMELVNSLEFVASDGESTGGTGGSESEEDGALQEELDSLKEQYDALQTEHTNLQEEHDSLQSEYDSFKTTIADAITEVGIETVSTDTASTMADNIKSLTNGLSEIELIGVSSSHVNDGTNNTYKSGTISIPATYKYYIVVVAGWSLNSPSCYCSGISGTTISTFSGGAYAAPVKAYVVKSSGTAHTVTVGMNTGESNIRGYMGIALGIK